MSCQFSFHLLSHKGVKPKKKGGKPLRELVDGTLAMSASVTRKRNTCRVAFRQGLEIVLGEGS